MPKCPKCGADNNPGDNFCMSCGANMSTAPQAPAQQPVAKSLAIKSPTPANLPVDRKVLLVLVIVIIVIIAAVVLSSSGPLGPSGPNAPSSSSADPFAEAKDASNQIELCMNDIETLLMSEKYSEVSQKSLSCKTYATLYSQALDRIDLGRLNPEQKDELFARKLEPSVADSIFDAMYHVAIAVTKSQSDDISGFTTSFEDFVSSVDDAIYYIYRMKVEHPNYYSKYLEESSSTESEFLLEFANLYQLRNQLVTETSQNDYYSYFYNVDPQDKTVVYVTDKILDGVLDDEQRKQILLDYVRENIDYKHDPNWYLDWPMPPAYTLLSGKGDCDDMSILLSSMMKRAGIANVELCLADATSPYDDGYDHMTVGINAGDGWYIYEPTCDSCTSNAPDDVSLWSVSCSGIEEFLMNSDSEQSSDDDLAQIYSGVPLYCTRTVSDDSGTVKLDIWMEYPFARMVVSQSLNGYDSETTVLKEFGHAIYAYSPSDSGDNWYEIPEGDDLDIPSPEDILSSPLECQYVEDLDDSMFLVPKGAVILQI